MNKPITLLLLAGAIAFALSTIALNASQTTRKNERSSPESRLIRLIPASPGATLATSHSNNGVSPISAMEYPGYDSGHDLYGNSIVAPRD